MSFNLYLLWALFLASLVPLALIATRNELRRVRFRVVEDLRKHLFEEQRDLPQLELAASRYSSTGEQTGNGGETRQSLVRIWTGALVFVAISFIGFALLMVPRGSLLALKPSQFPQITDALLWGASSPVPPLDDLARTVTIVGVAFLGGYVFQIRYLVRAMLNQELGALAFVRATVTLIQGMIIALIVYRAASAAGVAADSGASPAFASALALAFIIGFLPNVGLARISQLAGVRNKGVDQKALDAAKVIPLEVIDGIDHETAYRLEESNLFDVQNLATTNPISLYAETPFCLLEIFDWALQAQLCVNVGAEAFEELRKHKIRTIFDLERAVLAQGSPDDFVRALGGVIFLNASKAFRRSVGLPPSAGDEPLAGVQVSRETVRHAVAIMSDDLHVHQLRVLWRIMLRTTAGLREGDSPWLYETGPLPGDGAYVDMPLKSPAEEYVRLAVYHAGQYATMKAGPVDPGILQGKRMEALDAANRAVAADSSARERLRRLWAPTYLRKRPDETSLEIFQDDPDFRQLLAA